MVNDHGSFKEVFALRKIDEVSLKKWKKRINKLLSKNKKEWTRAENIDFAYYKLDIGEEISYDEFVLMLSTGDELCFTHDDIVYEIYYESPCSIIFYRGEYRGTEKISSSQEEYSTIVELLDKVRIQEKTIEEIWDDCELL